MSAELGRAGPGHSADDSLRRACDQCRVRKIRCDKSAPCSNCQISKRTCSSTGAGQKPRIQRQRVLISEQYERKIDLIDERLANIEDLLKRVSIHPPADIPRPQSHPNSHTPSAIAESVIHSHSDPRTENDADDASESSFGGDSSLPAHTVFATEFLNIASHSPDLRTEAPGSNIESALTLLRQLVSLQKRQSSSSDVFRFPKQVPIPPGGLSQMPMPPPEATYATFAEIERLEGMSPSMFWYICSFSGPETFKERCRGLYRRDSDECSFASFIIVNAGLFYLFMEGSFVGDDEAAKTRSREHAEICRVNLETAISNLPMFLPARGETIEALHLGTLYCIDISRPSLAWQLTAKAAEMCHALGYHRPRPGGEAARPLVEGPDPRSLMFWHTYILDSYLSLRMGRPPIMREWDIGVTTDVLLSSMGNIWGGVMQAWVRHSEIQNRLYKHLYSQAALSQSPAERAHWARRLGKELEDLALEAARSTGPIKAELDAINPSAFIEMQVSGNEIAFYSTMTLAYRAVPAPEGSPSRFCPECIGAARQSMAAHQKRMGDISSGEHMKAVYIHWAIMLTPFTPFFVLLCHVIDTSEANDLARLEAFTASLVPAAPFSEPVQKLHRLCQVMCSIAKFYVEAKAQRAASAHPSAEDQGQETQGLWPVGDEFEAYLGELGFMSWDMYPPAAAASTVDVGMEESMQQPQQHQQQQGHGHGYGHGQGAELLEWFSGNRNMMGLLEEDLADFDPMVWNIA